jgi:ferredoxin
MDQYEERVIAGLRVRIDRTLCVAFEDCAHLEPTVFHLADDGVVTFVAEPPPITQQQLMHACEACPVSALSLFTESGEPLLNA